MIEDDLISLCQHLDVPEQEFKKPFSVWRFAVLHVRGVDSLTTDDVYNYFSQTAHSIEWLSKISCNVAFHDWQTCVNAMLNVANGLVIHKNDMTDDLPSFGLEVYSSDSLEVPVPPNYRYILGNPHPKAKSILIRFATINDKKVVITTQQTGPPTKLKDELPKDRTFDQRLPHKSILGGRIQEKSSSNVRMRMHADDEPSLKKPELNQIIVRHLGVSSRQPANTQTIASKREIRIGNGNQSRSSVFDRVGFGNKEAKGELVVVRQLGLRSDPTRSIKERIGDGPHKSNVLSRIGTRISKPKPEVKKSIWRSTDKSAFHGDLRSKLKSTVRVQVQYDNDEDERMVD